MSANRLKLQGTVNEDQRKEERDVNGLLLGFLRALVSESGLAPARPEGPAKAGAGAGE